MNNNRIALITGANRGIGLEIARQLAEHGVLPILTARDEHQARAAAADIMASGQSAQWLQLDVTDAASISAAASKIMAQHGKLDILVNNAGIFDFGDAKPSEASIDAVRRVMETNFIGALAVTQAMLPLLRAARTASIVNLSSSLGSLTLNGDPASTYYAQQYIGYNASKAALNMLTVQLHQELRGTGISVNSVSPGFVKTGLTGYGTMTPTEGARLPVEYALGSEKSGCFMEPDGETPW